MLKLEMLTDDKNLVQLARDYWSRDENGSWTHDTRDLTARYGVPKGRLHEFVAKTCTATSTSFACPGCHTARAVESRSRYEALLREAKRVDRDPRARWAALCPTCRSAEEARRRHEAAERDRLKEQTIIAWLERESLDRPPVSYASAPLLDAFLITGLLRYAGDAWQGDRLAAWDSYRPPLCATAADIVDVYAQLYTRGWITPSANSPLDAFTVDDSGNVRFSALRVNWTLAADMSGLPCDSMLEVAESILHEASSDELGELWYWVCLTELKGQFEYVHDRFQFRSNGWTPAVEKNLRQLLNECSLSRAKSVIFLCFNSLSARLKDKEYATWHVHKMIPGSFLRTFEHYRANGWAIKTVNRQSPAKEPIYTSHLFNRVLEGGNDLYDELTGQYFDRRRGDSVQA